MIVIRNVNLLGDTLYTLKPLAEYRMQYPDEEMAIGVGHGFAAEMVMRQFSGLCRVDRFDALQDEFPAGGAPHVDLSSGVAAGIAAVHLHTTRKYLHISECFARMLGVDTAGWNGDYKPLLGWAANLLGWSLSEWPYVMIAPFSRSCSGNLGMRPNKTVPHERWTQLIVYLQSCGFDVRILIAPGEVWHGLPLPGCCADTRAI